MREKLVSIIRIMEYDKHMKNTYMCMVSGNIFTINGNLYFLTLIDYCMFCVSFTHLDLGVVD